ncbi:hypothetical protein BOW37_05620 [Solemya velum gill symbiont]|nr:hypothetical protein BOW37_05620 [Solemya velum gill symbiont]OOZ57898.1 hypothetical protein BOW42_00435 [Solemya velum gill symbiont]OOZ61246.1 hypothetical protein BOW44_08890 [Solemya velum gill symbiont]OOZ66380.1 hypothetical protein BOW46_07465 [Solemya velum gill symbiont]OOZ71803.1 hypothetical protein BOW48_05780 [Solemya velum gill symbiont]
MPISKVSKLTTRSISQPVESLLKACFRGDVVQWPGESAAFRQEVLDVLHQHAIAPLLLFHHDQAAVLQNWPSSLLQALKKIAKQEAVREMVWEEELKSVLCTMKERGILPILTKGTAFSYTLYPKMGLRPRSDVDLLIAKEQSELVAELMREIGYDSQFEQAGDFLSSQTSFSKSGKLGVTQYFDIHRQISNASLPFSRALSYPELMDRAVDIPALGSNARTLSNVDALLYACFHRAGHYAYEGEHLIWLYDIHLLVEGMSDDELSSFFEKAREMRILGACADAILSAQAWFNTKLSTGFSEKLTSSLQADASIEYIADGRLTGIKRRAWLEANELGTWRERFRLYYEKLFPPAKYMVWRYGIKNRAFLPFYYCYRLFFAIYVLIKG